MMLVIIDNDGDNNGDNGADGDDGDIWQDSTVKVFHIPLYLGKTVMMVSLKTVNVYNIPL